MEQHEGRNGSETLVRLTEMPMVQADNSKDGLLRIFLMNIKSCTSTRARELYEWLKRKVVSPVIEGDDAPTVVSWLDSTAEKLCRQGVTDPTLQLAFPTLEIPKFLKWWHYYSSVRR